MLSPSELLTFLARNQFLSSIQSETLGKDRQRYLSSLQLCGDLVQRGWLTPYQQAQILSGQPEKLIIGPYRLQSPLGEGGMGMVFKANQPKLDRTVALKVIRPQVLAARPEILSRFHREAKAIAQLNHPNIVILFDADEANGTHFIAMEYVEGPTLEKMVRSQGPLAIRQAAEYIRQCALGLQHAYEVGLVHRDIKPTNILVVQKALSGGTNRESSLRLARPALITPRDRSSSGGLQRPVSWGQVKILDMGLARLTEGADEAPQGQEFTPLTRAGALLGTPDFIAPEQARDARSVTIRADIYSLGCTLYYLLTGKPPFPGGTDVQKLIRHQNERPFPIEELRPGIPAQVVSILARMMEKRPEDRYQTPQQLADDLSEYLTPLTPGPSLPNHAVAETPPVAETPIPEPYIADDDESATYPEATRISTDLPPATSVAHEVRPTIGISCHSGIVGAVAISGNGTMVATAGVDGRVRLWDVAGANPREIATLPRVGAEFQSVVFSPKDDFVVAGGTLQGTARVWRWDYRDGKVIEWGAYQGDKVSVPSMAFSSDGRRFIAAIGSFVVLWKVNGMSAGTGEVLKGSGRLLRTVAFDWHGKRFVSGGDGTQVSLWSSGWFGTKVKARFETHSGGVTSLAFSPDGRRLAAALLDRTITVWFTNDTRAESGLTLQGQIDNPKLIRFLADGNLMSIGESGQCIVWDPATGLKKHEVKLARGIASAVALSPDASKIATGSTDGRASTFQLPRPTVLTSVGV